MPEEVKVKFDGDPQALLRAYEKLEAKYGDLEKKLEDLKNKNEEAGKKGEDAGGMIARGMIIAQGAVKLAKEGLEALNAEWEKAARNEREAADDAIRFGQALRDVQLNLPAGLANPQQAFLGIAGRVGADPADIALAAGPAFSARGSLSDEQTLATIEAAYQLNPRNAEQSNRVLSMALDLMKTGEVSDPRAAIGFISNIQQGMRVEDIAQLGPTFAAIANLSLREGVSKEEAAELIATVQQIKGDVTGSTSATGSINFGNQLLDASYLQGDINQRIAQLRGDAGLRQRFESEASLDAQTGNIFKALIAGDPRLLAAEQAAQATILPFDETQLSTFQGVLNLRQANPVDQIVTMAEQQQTAQTATNINDRRRQIRGQAFTQFKAALDDVDLVGLDAIEQSILEKRAHASGRDPAQMAQLLRGAASQTDIFFGSMARDDKDRLREAAERLDEAAQAMRSLNQPAEAPAAASRDRSQEGS